VSAALADLPPAASEYTSAHVVPGHGTHAGLHAVELLGHADCWQSGWSWADSEMAARAASKMLAWTIRRADAHAAREARVA